jgi:hypothetical protein
VTNPNCDTVKRRVYDPRAVKLAASVAARYPTVPLQVQALRLMLYVKPSTARALLRRAATLPEN